MQKTTERQLVASHRANHQLQNTWIGKAAQSEVFWLILFLHANDNVMVNVPLKQKKLDTARDWSVSENGSGCANG